MSSKKITKSLILLILILNFALPAFAAEADRGKPLLSAGQTSMYADEIFQILMSSAGGNQMMAAMVLAQSTVEERKEIVEQMADAVVFAEAAKAEGLDMRPDIQFQIKWQTIQTLVQAYFGEVSAKWDFSDAAMRKYYNVHKEEFVQAPAARTRHILCQSREDALDVMLKVLETNDFEAVAREFSRDPNNVQHGGDLGWVEKGMLVPSVEQAIDEAKIGSIAGPVESDFGWHLLKVEERRPAHQLSYEEAGAEIPQRMQRAYIDEEVKKLRAQFPVRIDEEVLANLGGIPAPEPQKD